MKFSTEKKATLSIYTEVDYGTEKMECEVRALRRELEETRAALRLQTVRCRQLVAAFTTKLQEKEAEVRAGRELRDQQLGRVLRALLVLEARLRREQRHIRQQLAERDDVIRVQQLEIARLHKVSRKQWNITAKGSQESTKRESLEGCGHSFTGEESDVQLYNADRQKTQEAEDNSVTSEEDESSPHDSVCYNKLETSQTTAFIRFKKNSHNKLNSHGAYRLLPRRKEVANGEKFVISQEYSTTQTSDNFDSECLEFKESAETQDLEDSMENGCHEDELRGRNLYRDYQHNPVLECVSQILFHDQDEMETTTHQEEIVCKPDTKGTGRFTYHCQSIKEEGDEEVFTEGGEEEAVTSQSHHHSNNHSSPDKENCVQGHKEPLKLSVKDKTPSPPIKAQLLEEKACLLMASQRLTLVRNLEFEELDKKDTLNVSPCLLQVKTEFTSSRRQVPPAVPPKPPQLGAKGLYKKKMNNDRLNQNNLQNITNLSSTSQDQKTCLKYRPNQSQDINQNKHEISEQNNSTEHGVKPIIHHDTPTLFTPHHLDKSRQRQILSNGSLKLALNQDSGQHSLSSSHNHQQEKNNFCVTSPNFEEKLESIILPDLQNNSVSSRHQVRGGGSVATVKNDSHLGGHMMNRPVHETGEHKAMVHSHTSPLKGNMEISPALCKNSKHCGKIRVGSSVSSLITGSSGNSIVSELTKGESDGVLVLPCVSQIVRRFEDLGTGIGKELHQDEDVKEEKQEEEEEEEEEEEAEEEENNALRCNFEEFKLEDVDMDSVGSGEDGGRPAGDGAEARAAVLQNGNSSGSYEHFLEATGLSQKSILTPSRMYNNHRNVLKPKDVKHRSKVLKAAAVNGRSSGPVVKYWVEPFL